MINLRFHSFWALDRLRGGRVGSHWRDIREELLQYPEADSLKCKKRLRDLLSHAAKTVPFYRSLDGNSELENWPVVTKLQIKERISSFVSSSFRQQQLTKVVTSGSTGTPFEVFHDRNKRWRNSADTLAFAELAGYHLGDKLFYLKVWNEQNQKSRFETFLQNVSSWDVKSLSDDNIARILTELASSRERKSLLAYASALDAICNYCKRNSINSIDCNMKSIIAMSERLDEATKLQMTSLFGCPTLSRYSNVENGIIAQQVEPNASEYILNSASYHVEILKFDECVPVENGELGRIIVTDLFNYGMPMMRYETGDTGRMLVDETTGFRRLTAIEGRRMDLIYDTNGHLVSSFTITNSMWKYTEILQYQFVQRSSKAYVFILNTSIPFDRERELVNEFQGYLGNDAIISIEYVSEIPLLASGKRKKVRNEMASRHTR